MNPLPEIVAFLRAAPFRPFSIHTSDGREFRVMHPDSLTVTPRGRILYETNDSGAFISALHVVSVESIPETTAV